MNTHTTFGTLPAGWLKTALRDLVEFSPKMPKDVLSENREVSFVPMPNVAEVSGYVDVKTPIFASEGKRRNLTYFEDGDVIFAKITPCMENGKIARPTGLINGAAFGSTEFHVLRPSKVVNSEYLRYFLVHDDFRYEAERAMTGAVGQRRVPRKYLESYEMTCPPLAEQEKIVEILEEQLSRLDAALVSVRVVREKAAHFRRSLLHAAFTGAPTQQNPRRMSDTSTNDLTKSWNPVRLGDLGKWLGGGTPRKSNQMYWTNGEIPWLSPKDMGEIVLRGTQDHITNEAVDGSTTKIVKAPSVAVVVRSGILEHTLPVTYVAFDTSLNQDMKALEPREDVVPKWVAYGMKAFEQEILGTCRKAGTTVASIELPRLMDFIILLPPLAEQEKIVEILEEQLSRLDASLTAAKSVENRAATLRRSLLHSAFTGQLTKHWRESKS